jgi:hypothetical protein
MEGAMEEAQFVATGQETTWWVLEPASDATLEGTKRLGEAFGWGQTWYQDSGRVPTQLKDVWDFIQRQPQAVQLWDALATAVDAGDLYKRADWLNSLADLKQPKPTPEQPADTAAGQAAAGAAVANTAPAPPTEAKKPSPFAKKAAATADPTAAPTSAGPESGEQLRQSLSALADDPDVPLSAEDVEELLSDPDAAQKIAEAQAAIEAELEAELAAAQSET